MSQGTFRVIGDSVVDAPHLFLVILCAGGISEAKLFLRTEKERERERERRNGGREGGREREG